MPKYWAVATIATGPTYADLTIDGTFIPIGSSPAGGLGGHRVIDSEADPIPFVFHAKGFKGFPVTLGIVLSPLPSGSDIKFDSVGYKIPDTGGSDSAILTVSDGKIPIKKEALADAQVAVALDSVVVKKAPAKKAAAVEVKPTAKKGGKGE
jgi:hypothetical protein